MSNTLTMALPLLIDAAVKASIVLLLAFTLAYAWRGASAGGRHLLWTLTTLGLLVVPVVSWFAPAWQLPALAPIQTGPTEGQPLAAIGPPVLDEPTTTSQENPKGQHGLVLVASRGAALPSVLSADVAPSPVIANSTRVQAGWLVATWLGGASLSVAWLIAGWWSLARLTSRCHPIHDGALYEMLTRVAVQLGIRRPVALLLSDVRTIPMTWGVARPVVLLPREAQNWAADRLRMVLIHELAHVQRWDCLTQMLAHLACGLYWFHPLAWFAVRRQRLEQEEACDDLVLESGASGPDYAEHLLAVTTAMPIQRWIAPVALGMSRSEKLTRRLVSLLDDNRNHKPIGRRKLVAATVLALTLIVPLATAAWSPTSAAQEALQEQKPQPPAKEGDSAKRILEVQQKLEKHYVVPVDGKSLGEHALKGLLQGLNDPNTIYLTAEELTKLEGDIKGGLTGIGAQLQMVDERLSVTTPLEGSPALMAGVRPDDFIEAIDGQPTRGQTLAAAIQRILGPAGSTVKLKLLHADGVLEEVAVTRAEIRLSTINGFRRGPDGTWQYLLDADHKVGYVHINQFRSRTAAEVRDTIESLRKDGMKGLILDLRFCPGGLLDQAIEVCKLFLDEGLILTTRGPGQEAKSWRADGKALLGNVPLLILLNEQTASAAEIVAGSLRDNGRAVLLGTRSYGKGSVQSIMKLDEGGALRMTTANHYLPSGRNIQKRPGEKTWGVDPSDGYYIPLNAVQTAALSKDAKARSLIGTKNGVPILARLTPKLIEESHADPQLAAALRTTVARLTGGEFIKVGKDQALLADHMQRLEEMRQRREQLLQSMQQLDQDIAALQQAAGHSAARP
jgi:carboxyl-terminal processing protease